MTAAFEINAGDTFEAAFALTEDDDATPVDLTGWTLTCTLRSTDRTELAEVTVTVTVPDQGEGTLEIAAADTEAFPEGLHVFNVRRQHGAIVRSSDVAYLRVRIPPTRAPEP